MRAFYGWHPLPTAVYFALVLGFSMTLSHPLSGAVSLLGALYLLVRLEGRRGVRFALRAALPAMLLTAAVNPLFSHQGATVLAVFPTGNALTLESILYGLSAGAALASVLMWFACLTEVMTSDKTIALFGGIAPALSLLLSMALRFVPRFARRFREVRSAQEGLGRSLSEKGVIRRIRLLAACFSGVVTWSLENAVETANSMKARGYGLPGRTAFSPFRFSGADAERLAFLALCGLILLGGSLAGGMTFHWYPEVSGVLTPYTALLGAVYLLMCLCPAAGKGGKYRAKPVRG